MSCNKCGNRGQTRLICGVVAITCLTSVPLATAESGFESIASTASPPTEGTIAGEQRDDSVPAGARDSSVTRKVDSPSAARKSDGQSLSSMIESNTSVRWAVPVISPAQSPIRLVQATGEPGTTSAPTDSVTGQTAGPASQSSAFRSLLRNTNVTGQSGAATSTAAETVAALQSLKTTDAGSLLVGQPNTVVRFVQPMFSEPVQRGRRLGSLRGNGSYWIPARQDLDTFYSKIDSELVEQIVSISGPYTARMGPGFSFYDVEFLKAPRFASGYEAHGRSKVEYQTNGDQWLGRQSLWGGSTDWGYRLGYGHRGGSDYKTGAEFTLPTSYKSRVADFAFGKDLSETDHLDFQYFRLDQTDIELPGQVFDLNFLKTDSFELSYVREDGWIVDSLEVDGWFNQTSFFGDTEGKLNQIEFLRDNMIESITDVNAMSTGYSVATTIGEVDDANLTLGTDFYFIKQNLDEFSRSDIPGVIDPTGVYVNSPLPKSESVNPGFFLEGQLPVDDGFLIRSGFRADWVSTDADNAIDLDQNGRPDDLEAILGGFPFGKDFSLWAAYVTAEKHVDSNLTLTAGFGRAMRAPTLTELYAIEPFIAVLPQFALTSLRGNPNLSPETLYQVDLGFQAEGDCVRLGANGFYAWMEDYITLDYINPPDGVIYGYVNTDWATLSGGELFLEYEFHPRATWLASFSYVEGRDHTRLSNTHPSRLPPFPGDPPHNRSDSDTLEEPLPAIPPMDGRITLRINSGNCGRVWGCDISARVVDVQNRFASSLGEQGTSGFTTFDLQGFWQATDSAKVLFGIFNLSDKFYREHFDSRRGLVQPIFQPGQSFFTAIELTY